jgi:hypothetical protein
MSDRNRLTAPAQPTNGHAGTPNSPSGPVAGSLTLLPLLLDLQALAQLLSVSEVTCKRLAADGTLPPGAVVRLGRRRLFSRPLIERWVADGCPSHARAHGRRGRG